MAFCKCYEKSVLSKPRLKTLALVAMNCVIEAFEYGDKYRSMLASFGQWGYFRYVSYYLGKPIKLIKLNLFCVEAMVNQTYLSKL